MICHQCGREAELDEEAESWICSANCGWYILIKDLQYYKESKIK